MPKYRRRLSEALWIARFQQPSSASSCRMSHSFESAIRRNARLSGRDDRLSSRQNRIICLFGIFGPCRIDRAFLPMSVSLCRARALARVAWAIYTKQQPYNPQRVLNQRSLKRDANPASETAITYAAVNVRDKLIANAVLTAARQTSASGPTGSDTPAQSGLLIRPSSHLTAGIESLPFGSCLERLGGVY